MPASVANLELKRRYPPCLEWVKRTLGLSWSEIARRMGIEYVHLCRIKRGEALPTQMQSLGLFSLVVEAGIAGEFLRGLREGWEDRPESGQSAYYWRASGGSQLSAARRRRTAGRL